MNAFLSLLFLFTLTLTLATGVANGALEFEYGPRPPLAVFDPDEAIDPGLAKRISDPLVKLNEEKGIDVIVVILKDVGQSPPEHVAEQFAKAWCERPLSSVILHVPGRADSPWIVPGGKLVEQIGKPDVVREAVGGAERRARSEPKDGDKVKAAATEAKDLLEFWREVYFIGKEKHQTEIVRARLELEKRNRQLKITGLIALASFIPLIVGGYMAVMFFRRRGPRYFPNHAWQLRLGAPHTGGNQAVTDIGPPLT